MILEFPLALTFGHPDACARFTVPFRKELTLEKSLMWFPNWNILSFHTKFIYISNNIRAKTLMCFVCDIDAALSLSLLLISQTTVSIPLFCFSPSFVANSDPSL